MRNIWAIYKKEMRSYFISSIAYVILFIFSLISGYFFFTIAATYSTMSLQFGQMPHYQELLNIEEFVVRPLFSNLGVVMLFLIPMLTMRLIAEEKGSGTLKLLVSYPVRDGEVLVAKYLAALSMLLAMMLLTFPVPLFLFAYGSPELGPLLSNYLGLFLMGGAFISLGMFASSITERQVVASVLTFGALILFWVINWAQNLTELNLGIILEDMSIFTHFENFTKGVIITHDVVYYVLFTTFFMFLAYTALQSRSWRSK